MFKKYTWIVVAILIALLPVGNLEAQDATGTIIGTVTDSSGAVMANVQIAVTNSETNVVKRTQSDASGFYAVPLLPIGTYKVTAERPGFRTVTVTGTSALEINQTLRVDVRLAVGNVTDSVTVEASSSSVETQNATVGASVTGVAIYELPLNGRDTLDLLGTVSGVMLTNPDSGAAGAYSIGGQRSDSVTFLLDGGMNNSLLSNEVVADPNPDAVAEFRVLESNYTAEYGRNAGGIVSVVTKSGTNVLHGTAYDYVRNTAFDANSFFNNQQGIPVPILRRNQFGGTLGGPIVKDKFFFFSSYEGQRQTADISVGAVSTYTPQEAQGDFSGFGTGGINPVAQFLLANPYYQSNAALANQGIIDPAKIDPVAKAYFSNHLIPTSASGLLFPHASSTSNYNEFTEKLDYNIRPTDSLSATVSVTRYAVLSPFDQANVVGFPDTTTTGAYFGTVTYTHTFSPTLINQVRATVQRLSDNQQVPAISLPKANQLGIKINSDDPTGPPIVDFEGTGLSLGFGSQGPTQIADTTYAYYDDLSWTKGRHNTKFGFYFSPYQNNVTFDFLVNGAFFFYGPDSFNGSGVDRADFLFGLPDEMAQFGRAPSNIRSHQIAGYAQDLWRVTKRLSLTYGIRYEYAQPKSDTHGRTFSYIPGLQSQRFQNAPAGLVFPGDTGAPTGVNFPDRNDWAPRLGFAWDVFGDGKTSLRGGGGVFYDILKGEDNLQFNGQAPFFGFADIFPNPSSGGPSLGLSDPYTAAGAIDPFPSKPPASNLDFGNAGYLPFGGRGVYFVDPNLRTPYVYQYNLTLQRALARDLVLEAGYVGYDAHKLTGLVDVNPFVPGTNTRIHNVGLPAGNLNFSYLEEFQNVSRANFNSFKLDLRKEFGEVRGWGRSFFTVAYTLGHEIDNVSGFRQRNNAVPYYNHDQFRASGDADVRSAFVFSGGWDLPFDQMWTRGPHILTSGWSLYPILSSQTGYPLDVFADLNTTLSDPGPSGAGDAGLVRADLVGGPVQTLNPKSNPGNFWFDPTSFSVSRLNTLDSQAQRNAAKLTSFTYGTFPRNGLRGPGLTNLDLAAAKHFKPTDKLTAEFRFEAFNLLNLVQFGNPDTSVTDQTFGQITVTSPARVLQLALHLRF